MSRLATRFNTDNDLVADATFQFFTVFIASTGNKGI